MIEPELPGMTITLHSPGSLSKAVVSRVVAKPSPDAYPDVLLVPFLRRIARRLAAGWAGSDERFGETCESRRGEWGSEDIREGAFKVGTRDQYVHVRHYYSEPEQEMFPVPRTEYRSYAVSGLPQGQRLALRVEREWMAGSLTSGRMQFRYFVPAPLEAPIGDAFRAEFEVRARRPRILELVSPKPPKTLQAIWERIVWARHGGADLADALRPFAARLLGQWERAAADDPRAACLAGDCHRAGVGGVPSDSDRAAGWYRKAVERGDLTAMVNLAEVLDERGGPTEIKEATALIRRAAEAGDARAQGLLGKRYVNGTGGVRQSAAKARQWFKRGADGDDSGSQNDLASVLLKSEPGAAERWFRRAAEHGNPLAAYNLGKLAWEPPARNQPPDHEEALIWFRRSARSGYADAQLRLGEAYARGEGCEKDPAAARHWFLQAARQGQPIARLNLGLMYEKGEGGPASFDYAELWLRRSAEAGNKIAKKHRQASAVPAVGRSRRARL